MEIMKLQTGQQELQQQDSVMDLGATISFSWYHQSNKKGAYVSHASIGLDFRCKNREQRGIREHRLP